MNCEPVQKLLDACLDSELDPATEAEVQKHLKACSVCMALHEQRLTLSGSIRQLPRHGAGDGLRLAIKRRLDEEEVAGESDRRPAVGAVRGFRWWRPQGTTSRTQKAWHLLCHQWMQWRWLLGALAGGLAGFLLGIWLGGLPGTPDLRDTVIAQHVASFEGGVPRVDIAASDRHLIKPWFAGKLAFAPTVRDLSPQGFTLVGSRLDRVAGEPAAVVVYQLREHKISLFVLQSRGTPQAPLVVATLRGFAIATWVNDGLVHTAVSDVDSGEMQRFAAAMLATIRR